MQITIKPALLAKMIEETVDCDLYAGRKQAALKAAEVPKKVEVLREIMTDKKYMAALAAALTKYINDEDLILEAIAVTPCPVLKGYQKAFKPAVS